MCVCVCVCAMFQLQWVHVAATAISHRLSLDAGVAYNTLAFGISTEQLLPCRNLTASSGITWADCVYRAHDGRYVLMALFAHGAIV